MMRCRPAVGGRLPCEPMGPGPAFHPYTSGSTGKPKGLLHTVGGYSVWTASTFLLTASDLYAPARSSGAAPISAGSRPQLRRLWPLQNGATHADVQGVPNYPVTTASGRSSISIRSISLPPHAIRALMARRRTIM